MACEWPLITGRREIQETYPVCFYAKCIWTTASARNVNTINWRTICPLQTFSSIFLCFVCDTLCKHSSAETGQMNYASSYQPRKVITFTFTPPSLPPPRWCCVSEKNKYVQEGIQGEGSSGITVSEPRIEICCFQMNRWLVESPVGTDLVPGTCLNRIPTPESLTRGGIITHWTSKVTQTVQQDMHLLWRFLLMRVWG